MDPTYRPDDEPDPDDQPGEEASVPIEIPRPGEEEADTLGDFA